MVFGPFSFHLGCRVCADLGLRFLDLTSVVHDAGDASCSQSALHEVIRRRAADVVELSWPLQMASGTFASCRRHGWLIGLWAHPLDMQARSGHAESLFEPDPRLTTRGGFGRRGTRCLEFRRIDRACQTTLLLVGRSFEDSLAEMKATIASLLAEETGPHSDREGLSSWARDWQLDLHADKEAAWTLADAMADYARHLKATGASPRTMSSKYDDLRALGYLNLNYDAPKGGDLLNGLTPWEYEYSRKFSDSPHMLTRYLRTVDDFCRFLRETGRVPPEE